MEKILTLLFLFISFNTNAQFFKKLYKETFKYATVYSTYSEEDGFEAPATYFVTQDGQVNDITPDWDIDYQFSFGIRKISRLGYEKKQGEFYTGEEAVSLNSNYSPVKGLEYIIQIDKGRIHDRDFMNEKYLVRWISKWWSIKGEVLNNEKIDLQYKSADLRFRWAVNKRLSFSLGGIFRTHKPYGWSPIEDYLEESNWWDLAYEYNFNDIGYSIDYDYDGVGDSYDWYWENADGDRVADTDLDFRKHIYGGLVRDYNEAQWDQIGTLGTVSAVLGADYYFYRPNFWVHTWASVMPGYHKHVLGDEEYSYEVYLADDGLDTNWTDYNAGINFGVRLWKRVGIFTEYEITKFWDRKLSSLKAGINFRL